MEPGSTIDNADGLIPIAFDWAIAGGERTEPSFDDRSPSLKTRNQPAVFENHGQDSRIREVDVCPQLNAKAGTGGNNLPLVAAPDVTMEVRRLMPIECERLQGLPDDWTAVDDAGRPISDSARYRMIGNAGAVPVLTWIGQRLSAVISGAIEECS